MKEEGWKLEVYKCAGGRVITFIFLRCDRGLDMGI